MADTGNQPYTSARISYLAKYLQSLLPGLDYTIAVKWITAEKGVSGNVLGVTYNSGGSQHLYQYSSQEAGLRAAKGLLYSNSAYSGFLKSLSSKNATTEARALAASPWNHSYYTGVFKDYLGGTTPKPIPTSTGGGTGSSSGGTGTTGTTASSTSGGSPLIDLSTPAYFIGVVLVASVLILIGGIIILKPKMPSVMPIPL